MATDGKKSDLVLWNLQDAAEVRILACVDSEVTSVSFRGDSRVLACPLVGNQVAPADLQTKGESAVIELPLPVAKVFPEKFRPSTVTKARLVWSPVGPTLAVVCADSAGKGASLFWGTAR